VTLVGQGLLLPLVVRWLGLVRLGKEERMNEVQAELAARQAALEAVTNRLESAIDGGELPEEVIEHLRTRNITRLQILPKDLNDGLDHVRRSAGLKKELIDAEREFIYQLLRDGKITDEARRRIEYELDLEEASVANRARDGGGWM
jgi:CPA1 family monovalent cation:H+ antiporter